MAPESRQPEIIPLASESHRNSYGATAARIARRIELSHLPPAAVLPIIVGLLVLVADTQALALIPLQGSLATTYHLSASEAAWTLSATSIAASAAVPTLTRLGDRYGLRRMFLVSLTLVTIGQLLCSVAGDFKVLVVGRSVLGLSAAVALAISLVRDTSRNQHELNRNFGVITSSTGAGIALSFLFGGAILRLHGSVSDFFWIITGLSAVLLLLAWLFLQDTPVRSRSRVDWVGGGLLGSALVCLVLAISQGNSWGWRDTTILTLFGVGAVLVAVWVVWELRTPAPMVNLRIMGRRTTWPTVVVYSIVNGLGVYMSLTVSGFVQMPSIIGYGMSASPLMAGVYLLPISIPIAFGGFLAAPVIKRIGAKACLVAGMAIIVADEIWFAFNHSTSWNIVIGTFIFGAAYSVVSTAATASFMAGARKGEYGMIASAAFTAVTLAQAVGPAVYVAVLTSHGTAIPGTHILVPAASNYRTMFIYAGVIGAVALGAALLGQRSRFSLEYTDDAIALESIVAESGSPTAAAADPRTEAAPEPLEGDALA